MLHAGQSAKPTTTHTSLSARSADQLSDLRELLSRFSRAFIRVERDVQRGAPQARWLAVKELGQMVQEKRVLGWNLEAERRLVHPPIQSLYVAYPSTEHVQ